MNAQTGGNGVRSGESEIKRRPAVSVLIPCRNEAPGIVECLESVRRQESPDGGLEVIVADGESEDGTREVVERYLKQWKAGEAGAAAEIRVVRNPGRIVSTGLNQAIREARGRILVRMDSHTEYAPDYVRRCVEVLERTGADNVGGPARTQAEGYWPRAIAAGYHSRFAVGGARFHDVDYEGPVDTVTYGCWRREAFEKFGYFDEELVRNQDDEHNLRIVRGGGRIWQDPKIRSWYRPRCSLKALFRQYAQYGYWKVRVIQKHRLPASWRHVVPAGFLLTLGGLALGGTFLPWLWWILGSVVALYGVGCLIASWSSAKRWGWDLLPALPLVFATYHVAYGWGFLGGLVDFVLLRRRARAGYERLTR